MFKKGFKNKLTGVEQFVAVLAPSDTPHADLTHINEHLSATVRSHLVLPAGVPEPLGYLKSKLTKSLRFHIRNYIRPKEDLSKRVFSAHVILIGSPGPQQRLSVFSVSFDYEAVKTYHIVKQETTEDNVAFLRHLVATSLCHTCFLIYNNKAGREFARSTNSTTATLEDIAIALYRPSKTSLFPDLKFNPTFAGQKVSFQNMTQAVSREIHFTSKHLETVHLSQFVCMIVGDKLILTNYRRSVELAFVQNVDFDFVNRFLQFSASAFCDPFALFAVAARDATRWKANPLLPIPLIGGQVSPV